MSSRERSEHASASLSPNASRQSSSTNLNQASRRRAAKNLLRDYYVVNAGNSSNPSSPNPNGGSSFGQADAQQQFNHLYHNASLAELLQKDHELHSQTRDLELERQGLVYTRYHDLLDASDTVKKMKSRAESLDQSLESLRSNFDRMSQLCTSLASSQAQAEAPHKTGDNTSANHQQ